MSATDRLARLERRATTILRSPAVRWVGLGLGVVAIVALVVRVGRDRDAALAAVDAIGVGGGLLAVAAMLVWQVAAIAIARRFGTPDAAGVWARAQLLKYVPVPASAAAGFVGSSVRAGATTRSSVGAMVRQTGALAVGAATLGTPAAWLWAGADGGTVGVVVAVALSLAAVVAWGLVARDRTWRVASLWGLAAWAVAAVGYGLGLGGDDALLVGSAVLASWIAGQLVVPVPAGLGVREFAFVALVQHATGLEAALVLALAVRLAHTASDALMAAAVLLGGLGPADQPG